MKETIIGALFLVPFFAYGQSTIEFQSGTHIEVTTGANICADNVMINGTYSGDGTQCGGILPVELVRMSCLVVRNIVTLNWATSTETDNFGFEVERRLASPKGSLWTGGIVQVEGSETSDLKHETDWTSIGFVNGSGTSTSRIEYSFADENLSSGRYAYRLKQTNNDGTFTYTSALEIEIGIPQVFSLGQNYPNPFNPATTIEYDLPREGKVILVVYDNLGRQVRTLVDDVQPAGWYKVIFDAQGLSSGMYYYRIIARHTDGGQAGDFVKVKKLMFVK